MTIFPNGQPLELLVPARDNGHAEVSLSNGEPWRHLFGMRERRGFGAKEVVREIKNSRYPKADEPREVNW